MLPGDHNHRHGQLLRLIEDIKAELRAAGEKPTDEAVADRIGYASGTFSRIQNRKQALTAAFMESVSRKLGFDRAYWDAPVTAHYREFKVETIRAVPPINESGSLGRALQLAHEFLGSARNPRATEQLADPLIREVLSIPLVIMAQRANAVSTPSERRDLAFSLANLLVEASEQDPLVSEELRGDNDDR
jgi:hypothetical protein